MIPQCRYTKTDFELAVALSNIGINYINRSYDGLDIFCSCSASPEAPNWGTLPKKAFQAISFGEGFVSIKKIVEEYSEKAVYSDPDSAIKAIQPIKISEQCRYSQKEFDLALALKNAGAQYIYAWCYRNNLYRYWAEDRLNSSGMLPNNVFQQISVANGKVFLDDIISECMKYQLFLE